MKPFKFILVSMVLFSLNLFAQQDYMIQKLFSEANEAYTAGSFDKAIESYHSALNQKKDGVLFFNLANSYYRTGSLGKSIFYYKMAKRLIPRGPDIDFNLNYVRGKTLDKIEKKSTFGDILFGLSGVLNERESYLFLFISSLLFFGISILLLFKKHASLRSFQFLFTTLFCFGLFFVGMNSFIRAPFGVVVAKEVRVLSGPGDENITLFTLHEGTEFSISGTWKSDWSQIQLADQKKGWIKNSDIIF